MSEPFRILINLPESLRDSERLAPAFEPLEKRLSVRRTSCDTAEQIAPHLAWANGVLMWSWPRFTPEVLDASSGLRFCAHIDIHQREAQLLLDRGIPVSVSRAGFSPAVSEMALTLILASLRRTSSYHAEMWAGNEPWVKKMPDDVDVDERQLAGRRVGIIGFGRVGQGLALLLAPFACDLKYYDPFLAPEAGRAAGAEPASLEEMFATSEVAVCCAAANPGTAHLVTRQHVDSLQRGAVFVNVARAAVVDGDALYERVERREIYAALDVFDAEPLPVDSRWRKLPNAYMTPHRAGGIVESLERIVSYLVSDLIAFLDGQPRAHALTAGMIPGLDS